MREKRLNLLNELTTCSECSEIDAMDEEDRCGGWQYSRIYSKWTRKRHFFATIGLGNACVGPIDVGSEFTSFNTDMSSA